MSPEQEAVSQQEWIQHRIWQWKDKQVSLSSHSYIVAEKGKWDAWINSAQAGQEQGDVNSEHGISGINAEMLHQVLASTALKKGWEGTQKEPQMIGWQEKLPQREL